MSEHPILFSAPMVRAILDGRKTMTRRVLTRQIRWVEGDILWVREPWRTLQKCDHIPARYCMDDPDKIDFAASGFARNPLWAWGVTRSPIHMPRWASRITLEVEAVRVERLHDITEADAVAEGCFFTDYGRQCFHQGGGPRDPGDCPAPEEHHPQRNGWMWDATTSADQCLGSARSAFGNLWEKINGPDAWNSNPWVSVTTLRRIT